MNATYGRFRQWYFSQPVYEHLGRAVGWGSAYFAVSLSLGLALVGAIAGFVSGASPSWFAPRPWWDRALGALAGGLFACVVAPFPAWRWFSVPALFVFGFVIGIGWLGRPKDGSFSFRR